MSSGNAASAIRLLRDAQHQRPDNLWITICLAQNLGILGPTYAGEAAQYWTAVLALKPRALTARFNLGATLLPLGRNQEALECFLHLRALGVDNGLLHTNIGIALFNLGRAAEVLEELRHATTLDPGNVRPWYNLGAVLGRLNRPAEAVEAWRKGIARLTSGDDMQAQPRYNAACAAALAGCGHGEDAGKLDAAQPSRLRRQALDWLTADLSAWSRIAEKPEARPLVRQVLTHWQKDPDLAGVRDAVELAKVPDVERADWDKLWSRVAALLARVSDAKAPRAAAGPMP